MGDKMVFWIKEERGRTVRLEDAWTCSIYVSSDSRTDLEMLSRNAAVQYYTKDYSFVMRQEHINDRENKKVLKLTLKDSRKALSLANAIEDIDVHDRFRLYNVDVLPPQSYFYEHDIFPLAKCRVEAEGERLEWMIDDEVESTKYELPEFKVANLDLSVKQEGRLPRFTDRIGVITLSSGNETIRIEENSEEDTLNALMNEVSKMNPDFVFSIDGDEWVFPYLLTRAASYRMQLLLSREMLPVLEPSKGGITYFSYGKVHYRPSTVMLYGRIHIDSQNSFIMDHSALEGLYEIARICRMTLHTTARATIGRPIGGSGRRHGPEHAAHARSRSARCARRGAPRPRGRDEVAGDCWPPREEEGTVRPSDACHPWPHGTHPNSCEWRRRETRRAARDKP